MPPEPADKMSAPHFRRRSNDTQAEGIDALRAIPEFLKDVDVLLAGRYDPQNRIAHALRGSSNKTVHLLSDRYSAEELESVPSAEVWITKAGDLVLSGIEPVRW